MVGPQDNETRLVELAISGEFDSFAALYTRHLDAIYRYIYYRTGDSLDAEDLTEQAFIRAWEALPGYKPLGSCFIHWLYRIAHNLVVDHHRRQKQTLNQVELSEEDLPDQAQAAALDAIVQAEETDSLGAAIARLPEEYQLIITLRFIEGLGHTEIAQLLEKSEGACRGLQHRALSALNKILAAEQERG